MVYGYSPGSYGLYGVNMVSEAVS